MILLIKIIVTSCNLQHKSETYIDPSKTEASMTKEKPSSRHRENSTNTENEKTPIARKPESKKVEPEF